MKQNNNPKEQHKLNPQHDNVRKLEIKNEINIENSGAGQPHNAKKEALGPNTKR